jgi:hypothetical protein
MSTKLSINHHQHLLSEGFSEVNISELLDRGLIRSLTPTEAAVEWFQVRDKDGEGLTGGIVFQFSETFSQLRVDSPELIQKAGEKPPKYLSPPVPIDNTCAYIPDGCWAITEGMKDALAFSLMGDTPTGAIAGVSHAVKALPAGCGFTIIFDADAWDNDRIFLDLIRAGVHCGGKVLILPEIENQPKAGGCEYFKAGNTAEDFQNLLSDARSPEELIEEWIFKKSQDVIDIKSASSLGVTAGKAYGTVWLHHTSGQSIYQRIAEKWGFEEIRTRFKFGVFK